MSRSICAKHAKVSESALDPLTPSWTGFSALSTGRLLGPNVELCKPWSPHCRMRKNVIATAPPVGLCASSRFMTSLFPDGSAMGKDQANILTRPRQGFAFTGSVRMFGNGGWSAMKFGLACSLRGARRFWLGARKWGPPMRADPEAQLLAALERNKPVLAGYSKGERLECAAEDAPPTVGYGRISSGFNRRTRSKANIEPVSAAELAQMIALYREMGEQKYICEKIAEQLTRKRTSQCIGNNLNKAGIRLFQHQSRKRGKSVRG